MEHSHPSILIALATYNEIENLPSLVAAIYQQVPAADVLVIDDHSPDGTGQWCEDWANQHPWFCIIHRNSKQGLGTAARLAIDYAIRHQYLWLVTMDADWSHSPQDLPTLLKTAENADVVVGSRYCEGGKIEGWPWHRRWISRLLNKTSCSILKLPVSDASGAFRAYRVARLEELPTDQLQSKGYSYLEELLWHLKHTTATFVEVPIVFRDRQAGRSKASIQEVWGKLLTILRLAFRR
ncbi:MAG: polyprenol monophosphomannose synthase [Pirellulales bacterium]